MRTSRREQRVGYLIAAVLAVLIAGWLGWMTWGAREMARSSPHPMDRAGALD